MTLAKDPDGDFWSRRRAAVQAEAQAEEQAKADAVARAELAEREAKDDATLLAELDLPDPDSLQPGDNIAGFMSKAVPDRLRRRALRSLWRLNPALANLDGLVDYGGDYTDAALVVENMQTAYQVGKGMLKHVQEMARQAEAEEAACIAAEAGDEPATDVDAELALTEDAGADLDHSALTDEHQTAAFSVTDARRAQAERWPDAATDTPPVDEPTPQRAPAPRRMRFEFEG